MANMGRIENRLDTVLRNTFNVITRAVLWKIPHNSGQEDVRLKLARYKKIGELGFHRLESKDPKSELTLDQEEFQALMCFLQENYEPFRTGVKAFIPLEHPLDSEIAVRIRALFASPDVPSLVEFILANNIIPMELLAGLRQARRAKAISKFVSMLNENLVENEWQTWFKKNSWVLGSEFVATLDERDLDTQRIVDFLMKSYDGFIDVVEIKRPGAGLEFWAANLDHGNYVPSADLTKAVTQASRYIYELEREANSVKFLDRVGGLKTVKPRCTLIFGRSDKWNKHQIESYRIMNSTFHNLTILTYDHVLARAKLIAGFE